MIKTLICDPFYLTQAEVAELICKKPRWLERTRYVGVGPPFRYIGRTLVYEKSKIYRIGVYSP